MVGILNVACIQMTSSPDMLDNLEKAEMFIREAVKSGANFISTPENTCQMRFPAEEKLKNAYYQEDHPGVKLFSKLSKELQVDLLIGSMSIKTADSKLLNRSFLFNKYGDIAAIYDKIHLFDVTLGGVENYYESNIIKAGDRAVTSKINDDFTAGFSICYDMRFPYLYRSLAQQGANIMCVPAAFTMQTGQAHWEILLRARAIETGSYVIAPAQVGVHECGRQTWGHTMIVGPWGRLIAQQKEGEGIVMAELDIARVNKARKAVPSLNHDREYMI